MYCTVHAFWSHLGTTRPTTAARGCVSIAPDLSDKGSFHTRPAVGAAWRQAPRPATVEALPASRAHPPLHRAATAAAAVGRRPRQHRCYTGARDGANRWRSGAALPRRPPAAVRRRYRRCAAVGVVEPGAAAGLAAAHRRGGEWQTRGERGREPPHPPTISAAHRAAVPVRQPPPPHRPTPPRGIKPTRRPPQPVGSAAPRGRAAHGSYSACRGSRRSA